MPRREDDDFDDDDRPRRRRPRYDEDEDDDQPRGRGRRRDADDFDRPVRRRQKSRLGLILGIIAGVLFLLCAGGGLGLWWVLKEARTVVREESETHNNFRQIGLGIHSCADRTGAFPNNSYDPQGRPLLSWRVHLLPHVGQEGLYRQFNLNEPWDGPTNKRLVEQMPALYGSPKANQLAGPGKTFYRGFSSPGAIFEKPRGPGPAPRINFAQVTDGLSNTVFVAEAGEAVEWTKPDDLDLSPGRPRPALGKPNAQTFMVLMGDGSFRRIRTAIDDASLRLLVDRNDGMVLPPGWDQ